MRPTLLQFRSPKDKTAGYLAVKVLSVTVSIF